MFSFHKKYFILTILLFLVEVSIAIWIDDNFIRPYFGDFLVVILIYCFLKSFLKVSVIVAAVATLIFSYIIETLQYLEIVKRLGLQHSRFANVVIGNSFAWHDILAYTLGILTVVLVERIIRKKDVRTVKA